MLAYHEGDDGRGGLTRLPACSQSCPELLLEAQKYIVIMHTMWEVVVKSEEQRGEISYTLG